MGPGIGVGFEHRLLLLPVYVLCPIYFEQNLDPNDPDEKYAALISTTSLVWIILLSKYEYLPHQETINLVW